MLIATVTLNPCVDKMVIIDQFTYGGLNRIKDSRSDAAGKGINVAVAFRQLGGDACCTGINYRDKGHLIYKLLDDAGISHEFVEAEGEVRTNLKIFDESKRIVTEINESGYPVSSEVLDQLKLKVQNLANTSQIMVFSGSVPKGVPASIYRELISSIEQYKVKVVLDAEGGLLMEGLKSKPYFIKPNLYELEKALSVKLTNHKDIVRSAKYFIEMGVNVVGVSMGAEGAIILNEQEAYYAPPIPVEVRGTAGAGDSMVAGFCLAIEKGMDLKEMLRYGVAAATASVKREGTLLCTREGFDEVLPRVQIERVV